MRWAEWKETNKFVVCVSIYAFFLKTEKEKKLLSIRFKVTGHLPLSFSDTHNAFCSILPKFSPLISFLPQSLFLSHHFFTWVQLLLTTFLFTFPLHTCFAVLFRLNIPLSDSIPHFSPVPVILLCLCLRWYVTFSVGGTGDKLKNDYCNWITLVSNERL